MNYKKTYNQLIEKRKKNPVPSDQYSENHHIIPRCMGGSDTKDNLIRLTAREHYIAHHLLWREYRTSSLAHGWFCMLRTSKNQERYYTAKQYEMARKAHINSLKEDMKGCGNHFYGRKHSKETKEKISNANRGNKRPKHLKEWFIENVAKKPKSDEHKKKICRKGLVMLKNINTNECIRIPKEDVLNYDSNIWKNPSAIKQKREKCKYCGIESVSGNIKRWHNERCKQKDMG